MYVCLVSAHGLLLVLSILTIIIINLALVHYSRNSVFGLRGVLFS